MLRFTKSAALVFFMLAFTFAYFYQIPSTNGNSRLALTMSIVKQGRLNTDTFNSQSGGYYSLDRAVYKGKIYTDKAIGSSVLAAVVYYPIYTVLHYFGKELSATKEQHLLTFLVMGLPSAVTGTLIYILCEYLSKSRFRAFIVTLAIALGTMCFPFAIIYFGHQLAATLLFGAFFMVFRIKTLPAPARIGNFYTFLIGLLLGLALLTDLTTAVVVLPIVAYYFYILWTRKLLTWVKIWVFPALGGLIPILLMVAYNTLVYGSPFSVGYQYLVDPVFKAAMAKNFLGIGWPNLQVLYYETLQPAQGLFWQSPVLIIALGGGYFMLRDKQVWPEFLVATIAFFAYLLLNSGYFMWWGGWSFGARQIVPMLPFLCLPLIFVPKKYFPIVIGLTVISVAQMGIVAASRVMVPDDIMSKFSLLSFFQYSTIYSYCLQLLSKGQFGWNIGLTYFGLQKWVSLIPVSLVILGTTAIFAWMKPEPQGKSALS